MTFDWRRFFEKNGIEYREHGPSTAKGNSYIPCPFCGEADQGFHMGCSDDNKKGWGCWKNSAHRGRSPQRLIQALLRCSWAEAARLAGITPSGLQIGSGGILAAVQAALGAQAEAAARNPLKFPAEIKPLTLTKNATLFWDYLSASRDPPYLIEEICELAKTFDLHYAMTGDWGYRLIVPVYDEQTRLATWTGRAITDQTHTRYKTLTSHPAKAGDGLLALGPITDYLLGLPDLFHGGSFLVIAEGPFDAFRLALATDGYEAKATCLFGKAISDAQLDLLALLRPLYSAIFLLLDPDAALDSIAMGSQISALGITPIPLEGNADPDEMPRPKLRVLFDKMLRKAEPNML